MTTTDRALVRSILLLALGLATASAGGCVAKPSEEKCKQAVENIRQLTGQSRAEGGTDPKQAVRSCRSSSTRETVECQIAARTLDALTACEGEEGKRSVEEPSKVDPASPAVAPAAAPGAPAAAGSGQGTGSGSGSGTGSGSGSGTGSGPEPANPAAATSSP